MSKCGTNPKVIKSQERKAQQKDQRKHQEEEELTNEYWKDTEKHAIAKHSRKQEQDDKKHRELARKQENKQLIEEEEKKFASNKQAKQKKPSKFTPQNQRNAYIATLKKAQLLEEQQKQQNQDIQLNMDRDINPNHAADEEVVATTIDQETVEKHPEKRMKASWNAFLEKKYSSYQSMYPALNRGQIVEHMQKEWKNSPKNPMNQPHRAYNS